MHSEYFIKTGLRVSKQNSKKKLTVCRACTFDLYLKNVFSDELLDNIYSFFGLVAYFISSAAGSLSFGNCSTALRMREKRLLIQQQQPKQSER